MKKSLRIHHEQRLKKKRSNYFVSGKTDKQKGMVFITPKLCSCPACGNERKHFNCVTKQEFISDVQFREDLKEIEHQQILKQKSKF